MNAAVPAAATGDSFEQRAVQLVLFLVECHAASGASPRRERELADWIARWQNAPLHGWRAAHHFVAEELGIILRALNGPPAGGSRLHPRGHQQMCWVIAQCMTER
ncbi:hypothetical protein [Piscinibacter sp.]|uniref:hypothetical protein n=1 Tax=Piscinibacter sp. TaxID=1903157 RepID=UPI002C662D1F|nr:hypothetical protein [Albitalea sp.]HUG23523.1 hypothetical protein [Albitalea sp.]